MQASPSSSLSVAASTQVHAAKDALDMARDEAKDAEIALEHLRNYLTNAPRQADTYADDIESCLDRIRRS